MKRTIQALGVALAFVGFITAIGAFAYAALFAVLPKMIEMAGNGDRVALWLLVVGSALLAGMVGAIMIACTETASTGEEQ